MLIIENQRVVDFFLSEISWANNRTRKAGEVKKIVNWAAKALDLVGTTKGQKTTCHFWFVLFVLFFWLFCFEKKSLWNMDTLGTVVTWCCASLAQGLQRCWAFPPKVYSTLESRIWKFKKSRNLERFVWSLCVSGKLWLIFYVCVSNGTSRCLSTCDVIVDAVASKAFFCWLFYPYCYYHSH